MMQSNKYFFLSILINLTLYSEMSWIIIKINWRREGRLPCARDLVFIHSFNSHNSERSFTPSWQIKRLKFQGLAYIPGSDSRAFTLSSFILLPQGSNIRIFFLEVSIRNSILRRWQFRESQRPWEVGAACGWDRTYFWRLLIWCVSLEK